MAFVRAPRRGKDYRSDITAVAGCIGYGIGMRLAIAFPTVAPTIDQLVALLNCHRATAYRIRAEWLAAHGVAE